jgi:hypothetical protein
MVMLVGYGVEVVVARAVAVNDEAEVFVIGHGGGKSRNFLRSVTIFAEDPSGKAVLSVELEPGGEHPDVPDRARPGDEIKPGACADEQHAVTAPEMFEQPGERPWPDQRGNFIAGEGGTKFLEFFAFETLKKPGEDPFLRRLPGDEAELEPGAWTRTGPRLSRNRASPVA